MQDMKVDTSRITTRLDGLTVPKISLGSWAFSFGPFEKNPWGFDRVCEYAAANGYDGVEINGFRPHPHDEDFTSTSVADLRSRIAGLGLGISGYAPDLRTTPPAEVPEAVYLARMASIAKFCEAMEISTVRVDTITRPTGASVMGGGDAYKQLVRVWQRSADDLAASGIDLVWEFEPGFWLNRPSQVKRLVEDVNRPNFGLLFDSSHAHTGAAYGARQGANPEILAGGAVEYAAMLADNVRHLHLIDSDGSLHDDDTSDHLPFGAGEVDFPALLDALGVAAARLEWWTVDFCFCPTTERDATLAVPIVRDLRDQFLDRMSNLGVKK
jgi:Sugar phosphate isomerases/epimerases